MVAKVSPAKPEAAATTVMLQDVPKNKTKTKRKSSDDEDEDPELSDEVADRAAGNLIKANRANKKAKKEEKGAPKRKGFSGKIAHKKMIHIKHLGYQGVDEVNIDPWGGLDPQVQKMKVWKKARKLGLVRIKAADILPPFEEIRSRDFDPAHCAILKKKLQATGSANAKGIKLAVVNQELETAWLTAASDQDRVAMFTAGHAFHTAVMAEPKYAVGGDHTRTAVTELHQEYPLNEKWLEYKGLTTIICGTSPEALQQCKTWESCSTPSSTTRR